MARRSHLVQARALTPRATPSLDQGWQPGEEPPPGQGGSRRSNPRSGDCPGTGGPKRSGSTLKVRNGCGKVIPLVQGKGAAAVPCWSRFGEIPHAQGKRQVRW